MPIGVPRIIYCWGEELPAQWTDIYNFIFRRRMVFLMQYLDDELCNQICGLLINIHMEDRSKELEKKEIEKSGLFKNAQQSSANAQRDALTGISNRQEVSPQNKKMNGPSFEDLLAADEDLGISENNTLEQYTLQKITMEWLNWNAQFFDYSDEPYLFYLAEMLSKDFNKGEGRMLYSGDNKEMSSLIKQCFKNVMSNGDYKNEYKNFSPLMHFFDKFGAMGPGPMHTLLGSSFKRGTKKNHLDVYSPFRLLANFAAQDYNLKDINPQEATSGSHPQIILGGELSQNDALSFKKEVWGLRPHKQLFALFNAALHNKAGTRSSSNSMSKLLTELAQKKFSDKTNKPEALLKSSEKALSQRMLRKEYTQDKTLSMLKPIARGNSPLTHSPQRGECDPKISKGDNAQMLPNKPFNYLDFYSYNDSYNEFKNTPKNSARMGAARYKQTERALQEEEAKKVFVIINSFGGSVGNGITVHDALQFIKAGSLTLALGVAASAASLVLAGGTIGERYVTEGCHVMLHQPECLEENHKVLTDKGWIPIMDVTLEHKVACLHPDGHFNYEHPTKTHVHDYDGDLYQVKTQGVNLLVTDNHKMYVCTHPAALEQKFELHEAKTILHKKVRYKKDGAWLANDYQFILPPITKRGGKIVPPKVVDMNAWLTFFGLWIAEGHTYSTKRTKNPKCTHYGIGITQLKTNVRTIIENTLSVLGYKYSYYAKQYRFENKQLHAYLSPLNVGALNKSLPDWVWLLSKKQCQTLIDGLMLGDGHVNINDGTRHYFTGSKKLALDFCRLCLHAGFGSSITLENAPSRATRTIRGQVINTNNPLYRVNIISRTSPYANYTPKDKNDALIPFKGKVYCLTVPTGVFFVEREGISVWTGNSSIQGQASDIWIDSQEIIKIRLDVAEIYSLATYRPRHKILRDLDRDFYLTATETIHYGLADEIATNEVMQDVLKCVSKVWDSHDITQQNLLEKHASSSDGINTQAQN